MLKSVHKPIRVREKSLIARFVTDADADTHTERIYGCLSIFLSLFRFSQTLTRTRITDTGHNLHTYGWLALLTIQAHPHWLRLYRIITHVIFFHTKLSNEMPFKMQ